jgi:copper homeostasis protein
MDKPFLLEVYIDSVESALAAQAGGAGRVELCDNLMEGGTTPSLGMIRAVRQRLHIPVNVIIRPRGGDFCYTDLEFEVICADIAIAKETGIHGIVIGILTPAGKVDRERIAQLIALARPLSVTFHKAFDMTANPYEALEDLIDLGVDRVLTSGQEATVIEGMDLITGLFKRAGERITIMPGGGITSRNINKVLELTGARELHAGGMVTTDGPMTFRNPRCFMGGAFHPPEYSRKMVDSERIAALFQAAGKRV